VINSRDSRKLINEEHLALAKLIFNSLTSKHSNELTIQSYRTFISTSIDYVYSCEKENWTLYIIVFIFQINSILLKLCQKKLTEDISASLQLRIDRNIIDALDTLRTSNMIFKILSTSKDDTFCYSNEIF
jgi:hypothetical protein